MERFSLEELYLLFPDELPTSLDLNEDTKETVHLIIELSFKINSCDSDQQILEAIGEAIAMLNKINQTPLKSTFQKIDSSKSTLQEYDKYFQVFRVTGNPAEIMLQSLLITYRDIFLNKETGTTLSPMEIVILKESFFEFVTLMRSMFKLERRQ